MELGLYVHVPFCGRACDFCAFYQEAPERGGIERYLRDIAEEMRQWRPARWARTVFWGGGTPGLLTAAGLERLGQAVLAANGGRAPEEWTVEMAPATVKADKLRCLKALGVTRISMGIQSFDNARLEALGRSHTATQVYRAYETVRESGIDNVNIDLIFAIPGQGVAAWEWELAQAVALGPEHISTYCLTFEEDTALWVRLGRGEVVRLDEEGERALYALSMDYLEAHGYGQYETSNFAKPGHACLHNINCWRMQEWLGYGPSAASQYGGRRFTRTADLARWGAGVAAGAPVLSEDAAVSAADMGVDALVFGLRMNAGVDLREWRQRFGALPERLALELRRLEAEGLVEETAGTLRLTREGRFVADGIGAALMG